MSAPLSFGAWPVLQEPTNRRSCVKDYQGGRVKLYGETQTPKLIGQGINEINIRILGLIPLLHHVTSRITNLIIRNIRYNWTSARWIDRADA